MPQSWTLASSSFCCRFLIHWNYRIDLVQPDEAPSLITRTQDLEVGQWCWLCHASIKLSFTKVNWRKQHRGQWAAEQVESSGLHWTCFRMDIELCFSLAYNRDSFPTTPAPDLASSKRDAQLVGWIGWLAFEFEQKSHYSTSEHSTCLSQVLSHYVRVVRVDSQCFELEGRNILGLLSNRSTVCSSIS